MATKENRQNIQYDRLIKETFEKQGLKDELFPVNDDPWNGPYKHFITRKEPGRPLIGKWLTTEPKRYAVAEIVIEPSFITEKMNIPRGTIPKIRVADPAYRPLVEEFCKKYEKQFGQQWKIV